VGLICHEYVLKKYDDWSLPSLDELNTMYLNLARYNQGGFTSNYYWSSSEYGDLHAWLQDFASGTRYYSSKNLFLSVRAVRSF